MSFAETRLDLGIDYNTRRSLRYSTSIIVDGVGNEQRNASWGQPLGRWQIGDRSLSRRDLDYFLKFHAARKGARHGFRFKDWADYKALRQPIGIGDGTTRQFQLTKTYTVGSSSVKRPILKPVGGTIKIYLNRIEHLDDWTIDVTQGIVTFNAAPDNDTVITADFEFDVPVRFEQDRIEFRFDAYDSFGSDAIFYLANLSCVELRLLPTIPIAPDLIGSMSEEILNLGYDYGTLGGPTYDTTITTVGADYEARVDNWETSRGRWQIGDRTLTREDLDYFIAFFRVARGAAGSFLYKDWAEDRLKETRFDNDTIEFRFDAFNPASTDAIFYLSGVSCVEIKQATTYNCSGGVCVPVTSGKGTYQTLAQCQAALIYPEFSGGQGEGVLYVVGFHIGGTEYTYDVDQKKFIPNGYKNESGEVVVIGPLKGTRIYYNDPINSWQVQFHCRGVREGGLFNPGFGIPLDWYPAAWGGQAIYIREKHPYSVRITFTRRFDGLPDTDGNPLPVCPAN